MVVRQHPSQQGHEHFRLYDAAGTFTTNHEEPVTVCLLAVVAAGCGEQSGSAAGTWTGAAGTELELSADGTVTGTDGCNHLGGGWEQDGDTVFFSETVRTLIACMNGDVWLSDPATATIKGTMMVVFNSDCAELGELQRS